MGQIVVRGLDDDVKAKLQRRARKHGRSTEAEVRDILRTAVATDDDQPRRLGSALAARFKGIGFEKDEIRELRGEPARPARLRR